MMELAFWRVEYTENGFVCQGIKSTKHQDMKKDVLALYCR
jgi:hypothetical protein